MGRIETVEQSKCLCIYLNELVRDEHIDIYSLSAQTGIKVTLLQGILNGTRSPSLTDLLSITQAIGLKLTIQRTLPFAHEKIIRNADSGKQVFHRIK